MNNIFLLNLAIYPKKTQRHLGIAIAEWHYSDVFASEKAAVTAGKKAMLKHLKYLMAITNRASSMKNKPAKSIFKSSYSHDELEDFAETIEYNFIVYEFDPNVKRGKKWNRDEQWDEFVSWDYNYKGELQTRYEWSDIGWNRLPSDYSDENAGTYFKAGDFVTITGDFGGKNDRYKDNVFVVFSAPGRRGEAQHPEWWDNSYTTYYIDEHNLVNHTHPHETQISPYEGEAVPDDHPLQLLRKIALDEIQIRVKDGEDTSDMHPLEYLAKAFSGMLEDSEFVKWWDDACRGRITFDYPEKDSWRNIPELLEHLKTDEAKE